ncbi:MAG: glycosyl transferase, partial [Gordonia sp. (in: high G+C Gram-positive bacteria)]
GAVGRHGRTPSSFGPGAPTGLGGRAGPGGLLSGSTPSDEMVAVLRTDAGAYTWVAAAVGSNEASGYQIATGFSVMPIGGFNGTDPSPTLAAFQKLVAQGRIHYFIGGSRGDFIGGSRGDVGSPGLGGPPGLGGSGVSAQIRTWVEANFAQTTVDGVQLYDLTAPK